MPRELEIDDDWAFQQREWRVQRAGWVLVGVLLLLAFLGLFGDGPLAKRALRSEDGRLVANIHRFERHRSPSAIVVHVRPQPGEESVQVWISRDFAEDQSFETVHPEPESVTIGEDRIVYEFKVGRGESPVRIAFDTMPEGIGNRRARVGLQDGPSVAFSQFVFP